MLDLIFLVFVSVIIIYRLYVTLGKKNITSKDKFNVSNVINTQELSNSNKNNLKLNSFNSDDFANGLDKLDVIVNYDSSFNPRLFLEGAKSAFKIIVEAFSQGDRNSLKPLLTPAIYKKFIFVIEEREKKGDIFDTKISSFQSVKILKSVIQGTFFNITVSFTSNQVNIFKKSSGEIIQTDSESFDQITDIWTFSRNISSTNINWCLTDIEAFEV